MVPRNRQTPFFFLATRVTRSGCLENCVRTMSRDVFIRRPAYRIPASLLFLVVSYGAVCHRMSQKPFPFLSFQVYGLFGVTGSSIRKVELLAVSRHDLSRQLVTSLTKSESFPGGADYPTHLVLGGFHTCRNFFFSIFVFSGGTLSAGERAAD